MGRDRIFGLVAVLLVTVPLAGCADKKEKLTYENFAQIRPNATTRPEVVVLLGEPTHRVGDGWWMYEGRDAELTAIIEFDDQARVSRKQWIDAAGQVWEDTEPEPAGPTVEERREVRTRDGRRP